MNLIDKLKLVPNSPGSYQMLNKYNQIIYVGKAKKLRSRLNSYFNQTHSGKTKMLVNDITDFKYIITNNELEAFILELNLIKKHNPKFNVLLKDDKTYPYIEFVKKPFPKVKVVRYLSVKNKKNIYGPFPNAYAARRIVNLINRLYPTKKCKGMPNELCLYFYINECLGYCKYKIEDDVIKNMTNEIISFLEGNKSIISNKITKLIDTYSNNLNYELAKNLKEELDYIDIVLDKQNVEIKNVKSADFYGIDQFEDYLGINILFIRNGKLLGSHFNFINIINDDYDKVFEYIYNFYEKHEIPNEIYLDKRYEKFVIKNILNTKIQFPLKGKKKRLIEMSSKNAKSNLNEQISSIIQNENITINANNELSKTLNIPITRIEAFDNSHLFGEHYVSGMVVFVNGKKSPKSYRKYRLSLNKNNDVEAMREVIYRRYSNALINNELLPDLIIVDGGKQQINITKNELNNIQINIPVIGLAKDDKHKTKKIIIGNTLEELEINNNVFLFLTNIQNEAHRFTINYHQSLKTKETSYSLLDNIKGIGEKRKLALLKKYKSIENIKLASSNELEQILPKSVVIELKEKL